MVLPLEPSSSPQSVQASSKNSTSVSVSWAAVGKDHRNGIIKGYKVIYQALPDGKNAIRFINISNKHQEKEQDITLGDLVKFTNYSVRVLAFTVVGEGPLSKVKIVQTQQDSKLHSSRHFRLSHKMTFPVNSLNFTKYSCPNKKNSLEPILLLINFPSTSHMLWRFLPIKFALIDFTQSHVISLYTSVFCHVFHTQGAKSR